MSSVCEYKYLNSNLRIVWHNPEILSGSLSMIIYTHVFNKTRSNLITYFILAKSNQNSANREGHTSYTTAFTVPSNRSRG